MPVKLQTLREWMVRLFVRQGMYAADAEIASRRLIESELLARPAGGVRWFPRLIAAMDTGDIDPRAQIVTLVDLPALVVLDGSTGLGQVAVTHALQVAAKKAEVVGAATVVVKNSRPVGDLTACLAAATSAGCVAGLMTTCKRQSEPWPIGPCTVWGWPGAESPLVTSSEPPPMVSDMFADVLTVGLCGTKPSAAKKRLFGDDAEYVGFVIDIAKCRSLTDFHAAADQAFGARGHITPAWLFDSAQWPETAEISAEAVTELRELANSTRIAADWA